MTENEISYKIRGAIFKIYNAVGPGLLESAYEAALFYELKKAGLRVRRQVEVPFKYQEVQMDVSYRLDLIVEERVIIEIKSVTDLSAIHFKQLTTYLKLMNLRLGLLVNFNTINISAGIARVVNGL